MAGGGTARSDGSIGPVRHAAPDGAHANWLDSLPAVRISLLALHHAEYTSRLAIALAARHEVQLLLLAQNARNDLTPQLHAAVARAVQLHEVTLRRMRDPRVLLTCLPLNRLIRGFRPQVLHLQETAPLYSSGTLLTMRREVPVVLTVHDPRTHSGESPSHGLRWEALMYLRRRATRVIVHGPRMREEMEALDPCFAGRVDAIPHGALGADPAPAGNAASNPAACGDSSTGRGPVSFLFFGRVQRYKGLQYLLEAGEILQRRGHAMKLVVAGTGADLERHRARIAASPWVELIDRYIAPEEVAPLFQRASVVVLPYTDATQSGVAAMAFTHAKPVISTRVGDLPEVVIEGRTGRLVNACDSRELADAMEQLLRDAPLRHALGAGAGQFAAEEISWGRIAEMTADTYGRAMESRRVRDGGRTGGE